MPYNFELSAPKGSLKRWTCNCFDAEKMADETTVTRCCLNLSTVSLELGDQEAVTYVSRP